MVLVTGATDGLGRGVARELAARGARVIVHGRDPERLEPLARSSAATACRAAPHARADFASLDEVRALAAEVERATEELPRARQQRRHRLGLPEGRDAQREPDGDELRLAVNYLAGFLLTLRLLPLLRRSAPARIVNVASLGQAPIDFDDPMLERGYSGSRAYVPEQARADHAGFELADAARRRRSTVTSLHPSTYMPTKIVLERARASVDTAGGGRRRHRAPRRRPGPRGRHRSLLRPQRRGGRASAGRRPRARRRLWELSLALTGEREPFV